MQGNPSGFPRFTVSDGDRAPYQIEVTQLHIAGFLNPQAGIDEQGQHGFVAQAQCRVAFRSRFA